MAYSGKFKPVNYRKYKGDPTKIIWRSLWERKFMTYCDANPSIIEWGSEEIVIPYISPVDGKVHRYFPDFYIKYVNKQGQTLREIPKASQTMGGYGLRHVHDNPSIQHLCPLNTELCDADRKPQRQSPKV